LYQQFLGEPDDRIDVYLGFGLFFSGIAFAALGLVLFLLAYLFAFRSDPFWFTRQAGFALGMMSVPTLLLGILVLLPIDSRAIYAGTAGTAITYLAVVLFVIVYPEHFNSDFPPDYTVQVVFVYGVGMALVLASTGAALVAHQIERAKPGPADIKPMEEPEPTESYSDEEIRRDIEEAMDDVDITWGGVERHEGTSLSFNLEEEGYDFSGAQVEAKKTTSTTSTDAQVQGLKALKGGEKKTAKSTSTVDDQTTKLNELRQKRKEDQEKAAAAAATKRSQDGIFARIMRLLGRS
ncbi:MAG: permease, partial [Halapricum sp.]